MNNSYLTDTLVTRLYTGAKPGVDISAINPRVTRLYGIQLIRRSPAIRPTIRGAVEIKERNEVIRRCVGAIFPRHRIGSTRAHAGFTFRYTLGDRDGMK